MIIVSQDKMMIINFNNTEYIKMRKLPVNEVGYAISIETTSNNFDRFAIYDTEERAKEVFKEIIENVSGVYNDTYKEKLTRTNIEKVAIDLIQKKEITHGVYYMPEE